MPRLSRVRFVGVGHPNARFEDVTLDLRDAEGHATDSVLWLRNGGGKSSLLNLLFAVIRTDRRDFLGGRADSRQRVLEDYILPSDRGVVVTEWELDEAWDALDLGEKSRLTVGVFYEHRQDQERSLRRLFFAGRVIPGVPETSLENLALSEVREGETVRRTLHGFREHWTELALSTGDTLALVTETQREWYSALDRAGIDPDLFRYQLRMNLREGGADELFRFSSDEDFVDLLLELTVDPSHSEDVGKNIEVFREQLRRRQQEYLPELEFCEGLSERLHPFEQLETQQRQLADRHVQMAGSLAELVASIDQLEAQRKAEQEALTAALNQHRVAGEERDTRAQALWREQQSWLYRAAAIQRDEAAEKAKEVRAAESDLERELALLAALQHHVQVLRWESEAQAYAKERDARNEALRPEKARADEAASALAHAIDHLRLQRQEQEAAHEQARQTHREALDRLREHEIEAAASMRAEAARAERLQAEAETLEQQILQLVKEGTIPSVKEAGQALQHAQDRLSAVESQRHDLQQALLQNRQQADAAVAAHAEEIARRHAHQQRRESLQKELEQAEERWHAFLQNPELLRRLEAETLTREELLAPHAQELFERAGVVLRQRGLSARARRAELERDNEALRQTGFLAPETDIEKILQKLSANFDAQSGWQYIAATAKDQAHAEEMLRQAPELARGVVVQEAHWEEACALLEGMEFDFPVVVGTPAAWSGDKRVHTHVLVQINPARFQREAGQKFLAQLEDRARVLDQDAERADASLRQLLSLLDELRGLRARFAEAWFQDQRTALEEESRAFEDATLNMEHCAVQRDAARREEVRIQEKLEALDLQSRELNRQLARLEWHGDAPERLEQLRKDGRDAQALAEAARKQLEAFVGQKLRLELQLEESGLGRERVRDELRRLEDERKELGVLSTETTHAPEAGVSLDDLRARWRAARAIFEDAAGDDGLAQMERHAHEQAQEEASRRGRAMAGRVTLEEVQARAEHLKDLASIEELLAVARERWTRISMQRGETSSVLARCDEEFERAKDAYEKAQRPALPEVEDAVTARRGAQRCAADLEQLRSEKEPHEAEGLRIKEAAMLLEHQAVPLTQLRRRAEQLAELAGTAPKEVAAQNLDFQSIELRIEEIGERLQSMDAERAAVAKRRQDLLRQVRVWCLDARFDSLRGEVAQRFRRMEDAQLEADAQAFQKQLIVRVAQLQASVKELDQHRRTLAQLLLQLALEGVRQLELAGSVSKIPEHVPEFGGERFLEIRMQVPQDPAWRADTVGHLLDDVVLKNEVPSGIELVQLAVRRLAGNLRVRVLNPNPASVQRRIPVTETAKFSGGEQLTSAILLFCTLANVRARNRGLARQPSSVLILDNPIGRASRRRFIEMQLAFARAMNVQLIYTTAVNDAEALSVMPNLIRLTNQRIDARRGHRLVEVPTDAIVGEVSTKRLTITETNARSSDEASSVEKSQE